MKGYSKRNYLKKTACFIKLPVAGRGLREVWRTTNLLTKKHVSKSQQVTNISTGNLNNHFSTIAEKIIPNGRPEENDLRKMIKVT